MDHGVCLENGVDGLQFTRSWLQRAVDRVNPREMASESATAAAPSSSSEEDSSSSALPVSSTAANAALNAAFLELLDWDDDRVFPEVLSPSPVIAQLVVFYTV